jgi:carboxymethylenebutenolidase
LKEVFYNIKITEKIKKIFMTLANIVISNKLPAFFAGTNGRIGLVVIQEWWGLNEWMKTITEKFAISGFYAVCPDLYHGKVAHSEKEASHLMSHLDWNQALEDLQLSIDFLKKEKSIEKIAVMGFCMGGALSLAAGTRLKNLDGAICFYGIPSPDIALPKDIKCPLQLHFGQLDENKGFSDPEAADKLENDLKSANIKYEIFRYPNCKHAFMNQVNHLLILVTTQLQFRGCRYGVQTS